MMPKFWGNERFISRSLAFVLRSDRAGSEAFLDQIRQAVWSVNGGLPLALVRTLQEVYERSMARTTFALSAVGIVVGLGVAAGLMRLMTSMLYQVSPIDVWTYGGVSVVLLAAATIASYVPARRAASLNPVEALRAE